MFKGMLILQKLGEAVMDIKPRIIITVLGLLLIAPVIANPNGPPWQNGSDMVIDTGCTCHGDGAPSTEVVVSISGVPRSYSIGASYDFTITLQHASNEDGAQDINICTLLIEKGADPFHRDNDNINAMQHDWVREIYRQYILNKVKELNREQRLAFAKILIDPKYSNVPEEVVKKIILLLKVPKYNTWFQGKELLNETNILLNKMLYEELRIELKNEIYDSLKKQYPGEELDNMIEFYRRQLQILTLRPEQRKEIKRKKRTRKQRLGISLGSSDLSSQGSKKKNKRKKKKSKKKSKKSR